MSIPHIPRPPASPTSQLSAPHSMGSWICGLCTNQEDNSVTMCSTCGTPRKSSIVSNETKTSAITQLPRAQQQQQQQQVIGKLPFAGLEFLSKLVRAFDYSNLSGIRQPMKSVSQSIGFFRPMSLWSTKENGGQAIEGIEVWLSRCADASEEVRGSALVGLLKLALASGRLTSMLRLIQTTKKLGTSIAAEDKKHCTMFLNYLYLRVEDAARDCLLLPVINKWECEECTALNDANAATCGMCMSPKNPASASSIGTNSAGLRSKTGRSLSAPTMPSDDYTTYAELSTNILFLVAQLSKYRLGSSLNGVTMMYEPFLVEISTETFTMFCELLRLFILESEIRMNEETKDSFDVKFEHAIYLLITVLKLNVRRFDAAIDNHQNNTMNVSNYTGVIQDVSTLLEGIQSRHKLPEDSAALAEIGAVRLELAKASGIQMIVKLMKENLSLMALQASGCRAMYQQIMKSNDYGAEIAKYQGVEAAVDAIITAQREGHLTVLLAGMKLLSKLTHASCYKRLDSFALLDHILNIMKSNFRNVEIQLTSLRTITNMSCPEANHYKHTGLTPASLIARQELSARRTVFLTTRAKYIVPIITETLHAHAKERNIQHEGCQILLLLAENEKNIDMMSRNGGIGAARTIIASSENDLTVQKDGLTLLSKLMVADGFHEIVPPKDVIKCMRLFQNNEMHARCLYMLYNLMRTKITKKQALESGVLDVTCDSMTKFATDYKLMKYGSLILAECLSEQTNDFKKSFPLKVANLLCLAYDQFGKSDADIGRSMLQMFLQLLQVHPTDARLQHISQTLTASRICHCMLNWPKEPELQQFGVWCIEYMTPTLRDEIVGANGLRAIVNAMRK
jgi:hypothetical protein